MELKNQFREKSGKLSPEEQAVLDEQKLRAIIKDKEMRIKAILEEHPPCTFVYDEQRRNGQIIFSQVSLVLLPKQNGGRT